MNSRNTRIFVFATALLTVPLLPVWAQAPQHPRPPQQQKPEPQEPQVMVKETPVEEGDPQAQQGTAPPAPDPAMAPKQGTAPPAPDPAAATAPAGPKVMTPEQIGLSFAAPQGWQQGDPTKLSLPGDPCCAWSPDDDTASIVAFVQTIGKPLNPKVLLEQSAQALEQNFGAAVKTKEVVDIGGKRAFSLVVTAPGNGTAIDGKGTVQTTQHWVAIPREQDVIIFLMTTPEEKFTANEQIFQSMLSTLKVSGTQTADQQASK